MNKKVLQNVGLYKQAHPNCLIDKNIINNLYFQINDFTHLVLC